ncbi:hypothetical protein [Undibacterium sp. TJN19]|uniref:hypothetical protein n=1 Tax=Undibacterium sp. TJN19 TaxID=3413055 RepID=UPI003BF4F220
MRNLSKNVSVKYSLAGCLLFEVSGETELRGYVLIADKDCKDVPVEAIAKACDVAGISSWVSLWNYCADLPGFSRLLHETRWEQFNQEAARTWLSIIYSFMGEENKNQLQEKWQVYLKIFCVCHEALIALPLERQNKLALMWSRFVEGWDDVLSLSKAAQDFLPLIYKLCLPPFSSTIDYGHSFVNIVETWPENERQEILNLDNLVWRHFERACRRQDNANLIVFGTYAFNTVSPFFLRNSMLHAPVRLFKTMRLLGSMAGERRQSFMRTQIKTEWFSMDWNVMPPQAACLRLLALSSAAGLDSPLPRRLREYFDGQLDLSLLQILRHCKVALSRLPSLRLQALEAAFWKEVDAPFRLHDHSASARHALRLLASLNGRFTQNRKGLRRFLSNVTAGNSLNFLDHPLNLRWYAKHPRVQRHFWHTGLKRTVHSAWGDLSLAFEYDPFEILMMGTYVDSCLGVGGICDYSTVACLLDANKQVLYARNSYGKVVARQLLAIDEADQLVCFAVYPENTPQEIKAAFKSYDLELAVHLSLPMYQEKADSSYDVTTILAQSWWDDGPWLEE